MNKNEDRQLMLERSLLRYTVALENGDFATLAAILQLAEVDRELEAMILEVNECYAAELEDAAQAEDTVVLHQLIQSYLPSGQPEVVADPPPLTVGHVIARIHADAALRGRVERAALDATKAHQGADIPLPADLSLRGVSKLLADLGLQVSRRFQDLFRDTAIYMRMGRNQGMARLAATRQQQQKYSQPWNTRPSISETPVSYRTEAKTATDEQAAPSTARANAGEKQEGPEDQDIESQDIKDQDINSQDIKGQDIEASGAENDGKS